MSDVRYFHDEATQTVYQVPRAPIISEEYETKTKRRKHPRRLYWFAQSTIHLTRADNWFDQGRWHYPVMLLPHEKYLPHEIKDFVQRTFTNNHLYAYGKEITEEEYNALRERYLAIARANQPKPGR